MSNPGTPLVIHNPDKSMVVETLLAAAKAAASESTAEHPEDIALSMSMAIESAGVVIDILNKKGYLRPPVIDTTEWV